MEQAETMTERERQIRELMESDELSRGMAEEVVDFAAAGPDVIEPDQPDG